MTEYAKALSASDEVINWVETTVKAHCKKNQAKGVEMSEVEHIIDYLVSSAAPTRLRKMSYIDAKRKADEWSRANQKKGRNIKDSDDDIETVHDFLDGTKIVLLKTKSAYQREGFLMNHCVGGYTPGNGVEIFSYRDKNNLPHATFELQRKQKEIVQIKGKGSGEIHPKYIHPILAFLKTVGMEIRPSEMKYLGYYHIDKTHVPFIKSLNASDQITVINGEHYAF